MGNIKTKKLLIPEYPLHPRTPASPRALFLPRHPMNIPNQQPTFPSDNYPPSSPPSATPPTDPKPKNSGISILSYVLELIQILIVVGVLSFVIRMFVVQPFYIIGSSMEPYLHEGELLMIDELSYRFGNPSRGDIIVLHPPRDTRDYIKRVIGLPGETIEITDDGQVLVNNAAIKEPYLSPDNLGNTKGKLKLTLGVDDYLVLGDNRVVSNDSRGNINPLTNEAINPWTIHKKDIVGKAFLRWWPLNKIAIIQHESYKK